MATTNLRSHLSKVCRSEAGSTIIAVVIGIGIITAVALEYADAYASLRRSQAKIDFLNSVAQIQLTISNTANDANSWERTLADSQHNSSMGCIAAKSCTTAVQPTGFVLWPAGANSFTNISASVYDGVAQSAGYTLNGETCSSFSLSGSDSCPIHVNLSWQTSGCSPAPCQAQIVVTANVLYRPLSISKFGAVDESRYSVSFVQKSNTSNDPCAGPVANAELAACLSPVSTSDSLICTSTGYRCGQVYH